MFNTEKNAWINEACNTNWTNCVRLLMTNLQANVSSLRCWRRIDSWNKNHITVFREDYPTIEADVSSLKTKSEEAVHKTAKWQKFPSLYRAVNNSHELTRTFVFHNTTKTRFIKASESLKGRKFHPRAHKVRQYGRLKKILHRFPTGKSFSAML